MIRVPELTVASSIPRLVHDSAHHLYEEWPAWTPILLPLVALRLVAGKVASAGSFRSERESYVNVSLSGLGSRLTLERGDRREDHVRRDQRRALEPRRLAVAGDLPDDQRGAEQRPHVHRGKRECEGRRGQQ